MSVTSEQIKELHAPFAAHQVSWRAQMVKPARTQGEYGALALAYIDSRDVQDRFDTVLGPENWSCEHYDANGKMACKIGIKINDEWVYKSDGAASLCMFDCVRV